MPDLTKHSLAQPLIRDSQVASGGPYVPTGRQTANKGQGILNWINVKAAPYTATGDGALVYDAVMAAGSATLTSASAGFTTADVGKTMIVYGAGASGGILATTISAFTSATNVTLAAANASGNNVSGLNAIWGTDDTAALQTAISDAEKAAASYNPQSLTAVVYLPSSIYVTQLLTVTKPFRLTGDGPGSLLVNGGNALFDFGNNYITGLEFDHFGADVNGVPLQGPDNTKIPQDIFTNVNLHRCSFHHLQLIQENAGSSIMSFGATGSGLSNTEFSEIMFTGYGDPTENFNRSVALWSLYNEGDKDIDVVTWRKCSFLWNPPSWVTAPDNSQWCWDIVCTSTDAGGFNDRLTFDQCDGGTCLGGLIRVIAAQGVLINQAGTGNIYNQSNKTIGHSMIYIGSGAAATANARAATIIGYTRETSGTITWGNFYDIAVDQQTSNTTIITPCATGSGSPLRIDLNGSASAVIINADIGAEIQNLGSDTLVIGGGEVQLDGTNVIAAAQQPSVNGLLAWNYDPGMSLPAGITAASGTVYALRVDIYSTVAVAQLWFNITSKGSGVASGSNFIGLYNSAGAQIAVSPIDSNVASSGTQKITVTANSGQSLTLVPGTYYVMILIEASGMPALLAAQGSASAWAIGTATSNLRCAVNATNPNPPSLPSTATLANNVTTNAIPFWVGLAG